MCVATTTSSMMNTTSDASFATPMRSRVHVLATGGDTFDEVRFFNGAFNSFNTYIDNVGWSWNGSNTSWDGWRSYGHDSNGSYTP